MTQAHGDMRCERCGHDNPEAASFCGDCGAPLASTCPACHAANPSRNRFCHRCGAALHESAPDRPTAAPASYTPRHLADKILTSKTALEGERKQVTVLFCDLVGSTALAARLGPDAMHAFLNRFFDLALGEVHRYEGTINQFLGDGVMALFGAPIAHEDHARRAVLAAVGIRDGFAALAGDVSAAGEPSVAVRIGVHTGPVVVGKIGDNLRMDYTAIGDTTNLAARLQQIAEPDSVYLGEATFRAVAPWIDMDALGSRTVKGRAEPVTVYRVRGVRAGPTGGSRFPDRPRRSSLVGRDLDVEVLTGAIDRVTSGHGGIVVISGEAGAGKSRLAAEVRGVAVSRGVRWLEGRAVSFGRTLSYWPFIEMLRAEAGITDEDGEAASWDKLERRLGERFGADGTELLPYIAALLGLKLTGDRAARLERLDAQAIRRQILLATRRLVEGLAASRPLVLVFEDVHWMDESSAELLEHLLPLVARAPVLVVVIMRPEREGPAARIRHIAATQHADRHVGIDLAGLAAEDCTRLVGNLLGAGDVPVSVRSLVLGRTGGNPFFVEEVVNALVDMRALVRDETTGAWTATSALAEVSIPDTVQGVIAARVDRLDEELRAVLKLASVIGRTFLYRVLRAITDDAGLDRHLGQLEDVALIRERRRIPELEYAFRHALVQEATYESLLVDRRRQLHREVARVLEGLFADRLDEVYGVLAYHASRAEDWGRARDYLLKAGDHASRIAADAEALLHYGRAIESYAAARGDRWDPVERAVLERKVGEALFRRGDHDQALGYLGRALARLGTPAPTSRWGTRRAIARETLRQIVRRLRRPRIGPAASTALPPAVIERCRIYEVRSWIDYFVDQERLVLDALLLLNVAERHGLPVGTAEGSTGVGSICDAIPLPRVAGHYHQRAVAIAEASREPQAIGMAYLGLGYHEHLCLGEWTKAVEHFRHAAGVFRDMGELRGWGGATTLATVVEIRQGALLAVLARSDELIRIGADAGDRQVLGWGRLVRGWTLGYAGRFAEAIESLQEAAMLFRAIPADGAVVEALGLLAQCELGERRLDDARATLAASEELIARRRLRGHQTTSTLVASAALWLAMAEAQAAPSRAEALRQAARSIGSLRRHARAVTGARSGAERMRGTLEWLGGDAGRAAEAWRRSLAVAESLGARYDVALTRLERGTRLGDREDVGRAESILIEIGAAAILERARAAGRTSTRTRDAG